MAAIQLGVETLGPVPKPAYAFIDIETSGLYPEQHGIVQVAAYVTGEDEDDVLDYFVSYANPQGAEFDKEAMGIHKIPLVTILRAPPIDVVLNDLRHFLCRIQGGLAPHDLTLVGHGFKFDCGFLELGFRKADLPLDHFRRTLCTSSLGFYAFRKSHGLTKPPSLSKLAEILGIGNGRKHDALIDAMVTSKVFHQLLKLQNERSLNDVINRLSPILKKPYNYS